MAQFDAMEECCKCLVERILRELLLMLQIVTLLVLVERNVTLSAKVCQCDHLLVLDCHTEGIVWHSYRMNCFVLSIPRHCTEWFQQDI